MATPWGIPSIAQMLPQRATIARAGLIRGDHGRETETSAVIASDVPCKAGAAGTYDGKRYADGDDFRDRRPAWFLPGQDIRPGDRVTVRTLVPGAAPQDATYICGSADPQAEGAYLKVFLTPDPTAADRAD